MDETLRDVDRPHLVVIHVNDIRAGPCPHRREHLGGELVVGNDVVLNLDIRVRGLEVFDQLLVQIDHRRVGVRPELDRDLVLCACRPEAAGCGAEDQRSCRQSLRKSAPRDALFRNRGLEIFAAAHVHLLVTRDNPQPLAAAPQWERLSASSLLSSATGGRAPCA